MKRVLMIAFHYPPYFGGSGIHRTLSFSRYLPDYGWQPIVLSANHRAYPETSADRLNEIPVGVQVYRSFALDTARHMSIFGSHMKWMALPDRWISWWLGSISTGLGLIRKHKPQLIWSTYPIATAHLIGLTLHRLSGLPWIADFRDPMTEVDPETGVKYPLDPTVRLVNGWIERPTLRSCSQAVFTTPGTLAMYSRLHPHIPHRRWALIPNGYDEENFGAAERIAWNRGLQRERILLVHSGVLYSHARHPGAFFAALSDLSKEGKISSSNLRIVLRGSGTEAYYRQCIVENGLTDIVALEPAVRYQEALEEMLNADGLLLFQGSNCNWQIPAKVYEYIRARRPIFAMTDPGGDTAVLLKQLGIDTIVSLDSKERITLAFADFLARVRQRSAPIAREHEVRKYSRKSRTKELAQLLDFSCRAEPEPSDCLTMSA
jgi:hypothetical protein